MCENAALPLSYVGMTIIVATGDSDSAVAAANRDLGGLEGSAPSPVLSQSTALLTSFSPRGSAGREPGDLRGGRRGVLTLEPEPVTSRGAGVRTRFSRFGVVDVTVNTSPLDSRHSRQGSNLRPLV